MVESGVSADNPVLVRWLDTTRELLGSGYTKEDLDSLLTTAPENTGVQSHLPHFPDDDPDTVYSELPPGLIDLPTAARNFSCPIGRIQNWVHRGHLASYGRLKAPARGGGYVLVSERELKLLLSKPLNRGGRPSKKH